MANPFDDDGGYDDGGGNPFDEPSEAEGNPFDSPAGGGGGADGNPFDGNDGYALSAGSCDVRRFVRADHCFVTTAMTDRMAPSPCRSGCSYYDGYDANGVDGSGYYNGGSEGDYNSDLALKAEALRMKEEELNRLEENLEYRERVVGEAEEAAVGARPPNWPPCRPVMHHDIKGEIEQDAQVVPCGVLVRVCACWCVRVFGLSCRGFSLQISVLCLVVAFFFFFFFFLAVLIPVIVVLDTMSRGCKRSFTDTPTWSGSPTCTRPHVCLCVCVMCV